MCVCLCDSQFVPLIDSVAIIFQINNACIPQSIILSHSGWPSVCRSFNPYISPYTIFPISVFESVSPPACLSVWMSNNISIHPSISSKLWIEQHASWSKFQTLKRNDSILRYISYRHKVGTIKQRRLSRLKEKVRDWVFVWKEEGWRGAAIYCEGGWAEGWVYLWETSSTCGEGKENEKGREWESVSDEVPRCCAELWNYGFSGSL